MVIVTIVMLALAFSIFMLIKCEFTYNNQMKILSAIEDYLWYSTDSKECLRIFANMEDYSKTLWRLWDFGCENILPKADYELIKPYIKEKRNENSFR